MTSRRASKPPDRRRSRPSRGRAPPIRRFLRKWWLWLAIAAAAVPVTLLALFVGRVPLPEATPGAQSSKILDAEGRLIGTLHGEENRTIVPLGAISENLQRAVLAAEDRTFYDHPGVSLRGILRATWANLRGGDVLQGGSTITQQYVRNAITEVGRERTLVRKLREAALAVKLEREQSKDEILGFYLNTVYFGRGAYGAEAAARTYFKKAASELTVSEAAFLAGVIRAPERYQPDRSPEAAEGIRLKVIEDLAEARFISPEEAEAARDEQLQFRLSASVEQESPQAAYFVEFVKGKLYQEFGLTDADIFGGGLEIHTTLDLNMQAAAEAAVASTLDRPDDPETALVAVDLAGRVKAMVGGRVVDSIERARGTNFADPQTGGGRQSGSAFKPFALAAFVDEGMSVDSVFTAPDLIEITSPACRDRRGRTWKVTNFGDRGYEPMDVVAATAGSINTVYAQVMDIVKPRAVARMAEAAGIMSELDRVCSLTLGTSDVTPLEMARAYATFGARGRRVDLLYVTKIVTSDGRVVAEREPHAEQALDQNVADTVNHVLQRVVASGTARRQRLDRPAAAKTGTTQDFGDAWFVGYTPDISVAVWMGYAPDDEGQIRTMRGVRGIDVTGGTLPGAIWKKFMDAALEGVEPKSFASARLGGTKIEPSPTICPTPDATPPAGAICVEPSPSPSPSPSPTPPPTPSPTPSPSPSPSPAESD